MFSSSQHGSHTVEIHMDDMGKINSVKETKAEAKYKRPTSKEKN